MPEEEEEGAAFEAREIYRESTAVLTLFHRACEEEQMIAELARQLCGVVAEGKEIGLSE